MREFTIAGQAYRAGPMDGMTQLHVLRRLGPIMGAFRGLAAVVPVTPEPAAASDPAGALAALPAALPAAALSPETMAVMAPVMEAFSRMPDEDVDFVLGATLGLVRRQEKGDAGWAAVWNPAAKRPMFADMNAMAMISIAFNVLVAELGPSSSGSLTG